MQITTGQITRAIEADRVLARKRCLGMRLEAWIDANLTRGEQDFAGLVKKLLDDGHNALAGYLMRLTRCEDTVEINGDHHIDADSYLPHNLVVHGNLTVNSDVVIGNVTVDGSLFGGGALAAESVTVKGPLNYSGNINLRHGGSLQGGITAQGLNCEGTLRIGKALEVLGPVTVTGSLQGPGSLATQSPLHIIGSVKLNGSLTTDHALLVEGNVECKDLIAIGGMDIHGSVKASGNIHAAKDDIVVGGSVEAAGTIVVGHDQTPKHSFRSEEVYAKRILATNVYASDLTVTEDLEFRSEVFVSGNVTAHNIVGHDFQSHMVVGGDIASDRDLRVASVEARNVTVCGKVVSTSSIHVDETLAAGESVKAEGAVVAGEVLAKAVEANVLSTGKPVSDKVDVQLGLFAEPADAPSP